MALNIFWTHQANISLNKVLDYLEKEWTEAEILQLERNIITLINRITEYPDSCPKTGEFQNLHKGLVDKNNYIIYRVSLEKIEIINFRGTKQKVL